MLNGELNSRDRLNGELTGGVFYGTNDYEELINKPSINSIELEGNKSLTDLGIDIPNATSQLTNDSGFITSADVPTATSQLTNDSGFITSADVPNATSQLINDSGFITSSDIPAIPTKTSELTNDSGFITSSAVPSRTSQLVNDSGFITSADVPTKTSELDNDSGFITSADIPTDVSAFTNDAGYITNADIPTDVSAFNNDAGYISNSDLITATASGSIATFNNGGDDIPVSEFECDIVAQQASGTPTPDNPLPITGFSQADISVMGKNLVATKISNCSITNVGLLFSNSNYDMQVAYVKQGVTYTITSDELFVGGFYTSLPQIGSTTYDNSRWADAPHTFTAPITGWVAFRTEHDYAYAQCEVGNEQTTYAPYTGNLYTVAFGQTIYGGRLIYANGQWSIEATHGIVDLGDLDWGTGDLHDSTNITDMISCSWSSDLSSFMCSSFIAKNQSSGWSGMVNGEFGCNNQYLRIKWSAVQDGNDFKTLVTGQKIVYPLATPTIIPITSSTRIKTISGDNNIYSNTGDCELKYFTNKADSLAELIKAFVV